MARNTTRTAVRSTRNPRRAAVARTTRVAQAPAFASIDSAQRVWLAGLGAISKARAEGGKVAEVLADQAQALVVEGRKIEARVKAAAVERAREARAVAKARAAATLVSLGKLEGAFQAGVGKTLNTFGIPSSAQMRELTARMAELQASLSQLKRARA